MKTRAYNLMKTWCDTLLSYEIRTNTPYTDGALLCPACHVLHGRIADLCFPLTLLWVKTGEKRYLESADRMVRWSEYNLKNGDGLWRNDAGNRWFGISAFSALAIGDALEHFGDALPEKLRQSWQSIFVRLADGIAHLEREKCRPVSNYYCGFAAALALAWRLTGEDRYLKKSEIWLNEALNRFDRDGLFFGEGAVEPAEDGSHTVDMGYNLEESLPLLLRYASITGNHMDYFRERLRDHLHFLLPDGAIDNSFGSRHNKWTYWGSRTSDGLVEGLALVMDDPLFVDACERVLSLYERSTHDGLLSMPMAHEAGEPTCLHHSFPHAKALAFFLCTAPDVTVSRSLLPCEEKYGIRRYQNGRLILVSRGAFRATLSAVGATYLPEHTATYGGSLNLLYKDGYGPICAATTAQYKPTEPLNQQYLRNAEDSPCMTAQFIVNGRMACTDKHVTLTASESTVVAASELWEARYSFEDSRVTVTLKCADGVYKLPIVCSKDHAVKVSDDRCTVTVGDRLSIRASTPLVLDSSRRVFHQVGGLLYLPIEIPVSGTVELTIE